jgi:hypothetical protein
MPRGNDSGFVRVLSWILITSARHGATQFAAGLSRDFHSTEFAQAMGAVHAVAGGVHPFGKGASVDGHVHSGHAVRRGPAGNPGGRKFLCASIA